MSPSHQHRVLSGDLHIGVLGIVGSQKQRHWLVEQQHYKHRALAWTHRQGMVHVNQVTQLLAAVWAQLSSRSL